MSFLDETTTRAPAGGVAVSVARWPGYVAAGSTLAALLLLVLGLVADLSTWPFAAGYVLGAVIGPAMAVAHRLSSESSRKSPWFVRSVATGRVMSAAVMAGLLLGLAHAWFLATELAKV